MKPRISSTGPGGIPFSLYRNLVDIYAPVLHSYTLYLAHVKRANKSFNYTNMFFFPKDLSYTAARTRPIAVSNTDNRIIANVVRRAITPAILSILSPNQTAFNPQTSIDDNIYYFNHAFYSALEEGKQYKVLFHDFKGAYDSVSRRYLFALLHRIGIPAFFLSLIEVLFQKNVAFPILRDRHNVKITMNNGLKQGCPLSPIFFLLVLDPLITHLDSLQGDARAFCDDVAIGFTDLPTVLPYLSAIDEYNAASGGRTNYSKLKLISTTVSSAPLKLPGHWAATQSVPSHKYCGVLMGQCITVKDVYHDAMAKFTDRILSYMPYKAMYTPQQRVIICNTFLSSIFSFLHHYFLMDKNDVKRVKQLATAWLVTQKRYRYDHMTAATAHAGLAQPLRDITKINIAAVLRNQDSIAQPPYPKVDSKSLLISNHIYRATQIYHNMTRTVPAAEVEQRDLSAALHRLDKTSLNALAAKFRKDWGASLGRSHAKRICRNTEKLPTSLLSCLRNHAFDIIHNALVTRTRDAWRGIETNPALYVGLERNP
jgi:hypothetical protein